MIEWRCCNGHTLGLIINYGRFNCLMLVDPRMEHPVPFATVSGGADVTCLICGDVRVWRIGEDFKSHLTNDAI